MANTDTYLHLIGLGILAIPSIAMALPGDAGPKRPLSGAFLLVLGMLLAHLVTHVLPDRFANFIYSSHCDYRSFPRQG